jgi:hypothetical protein
MGQVRTYRVGDLKFYGGGDPVFSPQAERFFSHLDWLLHDYHGPVDVTHWSRSPMRVRAVGRPARQRGRFAGRRPGARRVTRSSRAGPADSEGEHHHLAKARP